MKQQISSYSTPGLRLILTFLLKISLPAHLLYRAMEHCLPTLDAHLGWGCYTVLTSLLLFLLHILYTHLLTLYHLKRAAELNALPIPTTSGRWPGNLDLMKKWIGVWRTGYPGDIAGRLMNQLGGTETYAVKLVWKNTVFTADPEVVREMLTVDHANYIKGKALTDALQSVLGQGVFNTNGDLWRFHRSMSRPFFTRERLRGMIPVFTRHADKAIDLLVAAASASTSGTAGSGATAGGATLTASSSAPAGIPVDVQDLASKFTLDAATEFLFGSCVNSLEEPLPRPWNAPLASPSGSPPSPSPISPRGSEKASSLLPLNSTTATSTSSSSSNHSATQAFPSAFTSALHTLASRLRSGALWPLLEITKDSTRKDVSVIRGFVKGIVQQALERRDRKEKEGEGVEANGEDNQGETLLDHLVTVSDDIQLIQDEPINILIAGRDTTASCITFATYLLTQHPEVLSKLSDEVHSILPPSPSTSSTTSPAAPTLEDLRHMPYLRAVINETLRLFPSVPMNVRDSVSERVLTTSDGTRYYLPAGTGITYSLLHIHRSPKYWGPTAPAFDPERFIPGGKDGKDGRYETYYAHTPYVFMPFNAGPRSCLGQQLAYAEVGVFLCRLVQRLRQREEQEGGGAPAGLRLDEEAIPEKCRVPKEWSEAAAPAASEKEQLPLHTSSSSGAMRRMLPATTASGVSPRRMIEKVWPKSHLTMFVEGGVWVRV